MSKKKPKPQTQPIDIVIDFDCSVARAGTMADGSIRIVLDMPEGSIIPMGALAQCQQNQIYLHAHLVPIAPPPYQVEPEPEASNDADADFLGKVADELDQ